jgi:hypothetical protein
MTLSRIEGSVDPESILKLFIIKPKDNHAEHIANAIVLRKGELRKWLILSPAEKHQGASGTSRGEDREIKAIGNVRNSKWQRLTGPNSESTNLIGGERIDTFEQHWS